MRLIGLDWGVVRVGAAVSDPLGISALPIEHIKNDAGLFDALKGLIQKYSASKMIIGFPKRLNGEEGPSALVVRDFAKKINETLSIPVELWDERMTTKLAQRQYQMAGVSSKNMRQKIDSMAASLMLQTYLDSHRK